MFRFSPRKPSRAFVAHALAHVLALAQFAHATEAHRLPGKPIPAIRAERKDFAPVRILRGERPFLRKPVPLAAHVHALRTMPAVAQAVLYSYDRDVKRERLFREWRIRPEIAAYTHLVGRESWQNARLRFADEKTRPDLFQRPDGLGAHRFARTVPDKDDKFTIWYNRSALGEYIKPEDPETWVPTRKAFRDLLNFTMHEALHTVGHPDETHEDPQNIPNLFGSKMAAYIDEKLDAIDIRDVQGKLHGRLFHLKLAHESRLFYADSVLFKDLSYSLRECLDRLVENEQSLSHPYAGIRYPLPPGVKVRFSDISVSADSNGVGFQADLDVIQYSDRERPKPFSDGAKARVSMLIPQDLMNAGGFFMRANPVQKDFTEARARVELVPAGSRASSSELAEVSELAREGGRVTFTARVPKSEAATRDDALTLVALLTAPELAATGPLPQHELPVQPSGAEESGEAWVLRYSFELPKNHVYSRLAVTGLARGGAAAGSTRLAPLFERSIALADAAAPIGPDVLRAEASNSAAQARPDLASRILELKTDDFDDSRSTFVLGPFPEGVEFESAKVLLRLPPEPRQNGPRPTTDLVSGDLLANQALRRSEKDPTQWIVNVDGLTTVTWNGDIFRKVAVEGFVLRTKSGQRIYLAAPTLFESSTVYGGSSANYYHVKPWSPDDSADRGPYKR